MEEGVKNPFAAYPISMFSPTEINERWLDSILDHSSRVKTLSTLDGMPDQKLSLFGKIDEGIFLYFILICSRLHKTVFFLYKGVSKDDIDAKVNSLNMKYSSMRNSGVSQKACMLSLVARNPYRLITKPNNKVFPFI